MPFAATTRWHGTRNAKRFAAQKAPAARARPGDPASAASSPYVTTSPRGTPRSASATARWNGVAQLEIELDVVESSTAAPARNATRLARRRRRRSTAVARIRHGAVTHPCRTSPLRCSKGARRPPGGRCSLPWRLGLATASRVSTTACEIRSRKSCARTTPSADPELAVAPAGHRVRASARARTAFDSTIAPMSAHGIFTPPRPVNEPSSPTPPAHPSAPSSRRACAQMEGERIRIPLDHRRQGRLHGRDLRGRHAAPQEPRPRRREQGRPGARRSRRSTPRNAAHADWSRMPWHERAAVFLRAAELLAGPWRSTLNAATMLNQSKTAHQAEIDAVCEMVDFWRYNVDYILAHLLGAAALADRDLEPDGVPAARGLRLRGQPVQLHAASAGTSRRRRRSWAARSSGSPRRPPRSPPTTSCGSCRRPGCPTA